LARNQQDRRIKPVGPPRVGGDIPRDQIRKQAEQARKELVTLSLRFFEIKSEKFCPTLVEDNYLGAFVGRLKAVCGMTLDEVRIHNKQALRCHPIVWNTTSEPGGFQNLPPDVDDSEPFQMQISSYKHGRIHGFFIGSLFHLVWIDPKHLLYPEK
jgi:hypothetical protein